MITETNQDDIIIVKEELSPSGKYKLIIGQYKTKDQEWNYSNGKLIRLSDGKEIASINRNYPTFHHSWFIKNNHEWLQTGTTYMSQTFVDLDTGFVYDNFDKIKETKEYQEEMAFCWIRSQMWNDNTLIVLGCYKSRPYQYKFYDFSFPGKGWGELKEDDQYIQMGDKEPVINDDGTVNIRDTKKLIHYNKKLIDENSEEYFKIPDSILCNPKNIKIIDDQIRTVKRQGNKIVTMKLLQSKSREDRESTFKKKQETKKLEDIKLIENSEIFSKLVPELKKTNLPLALNWSYDDNHKNFMVTIANFKPEYKWSDIRKKSCSIKWGVSGGPIYVEYSNEQDGVRHRQEFKRRMEVIDSVLFAVKDYLN